MYSNAQRILLYPWFAKSRITKHLDSSNQALKFGASSDYSQLVISKTKVFNKLTMCGAVYGQGVLLQYTGFSSITGKDIYIATG